MREALHKHIHRKQSCVFIYINKPHLCPAAQKAHPGFTVNALELLKSRLKEASYLISEDSPIAGRSRVESTGGRALLIASS